MSFVLPSITAYPRQSKIHFHRIATCVCITPALACLFLQPLRVILRVGICNLLIILCLTGCYRLFVGKIVALSVSLLLTINFIVALCTWQIYQSEFNIIFAMSIMETHWSEVKAMSGLYLSRMPVCVVYFLLTYFSIPMGVKCVSTKVQCASLVILLIFISWFSYNQWSKQKKMVLEDTSIKLQVLRFTPFYTAADFIIAYRDISFAREIKQIDMDLPGLIAKETDIENYVIIVGESVRRSNMSLYGFGINTTPVQNEIDHRRLSLIMRFPAAATVTSVPMILSKATTESFTAADLSNNVIAVANKVGYQTTG